MTININRDTIDELQALEGIGPKRARAIIDYREKKSWFVIPEDIMNVHGIGEKIFEKIRDDIVTF